MKKTLLTFFLLIIISMPLAAVSNKSIYIKAFTAGDGMKTRGSIGEHIKDYISEIISERSGYTIISDDEVKLIIKQEELHLAIDSCSDEACIKTLIKSLSTDYIIYGTIDYLGGKYYITAKIIDRAGDTIKIVRVKTLVFRDENKIRMASADLARYLTDGRDIDMERYEDDYRNEIHTKEKPLPAGLSVYGIYFTPLKKPFKTFYDSLLGGGADYIRPLNNYYSLFGGISYIQGNDNISGKATVSINNFSIGGRAGFPTLGFIYPYIGAGAVAAWYNERASGNSNSFLGYGLNVFAGCTFMILNNLSAWSDYSYSFMKLNDSENTDISGTIIRAGLTYKF